jgi:hypothetical protein
VIKGGDFMSKAYSMVFPPDKNGQIKMELILKTDKTPEQIQAEYDEKLKRLQEESHS